MDQKPSPPNNGEWLVTLVKLAVLGIMMYLLFLFLVYLIVLVLVAGAIFLGAKLGLRGSGVNLDSAPEYERVHLLEAKKQTHLQHLEGESSELLQLAERTFDEEKMQLYRPKDEVKRPGIDMEKAKEMISKLRNLF